MRFRQKFPDTYLATSRISLVSSFLATLFLGRFAPIDIADVGGMNLFDNGSGKWSENLLALAAGGKAHAEGLRHRLGTVAEDGGLSLGKISKYFVGRYRFSSDCRIIPFTGDNPSTILALPLQPSDAIVSLGTSTTFLMSTPHYNPDPTYHFMKHPTTPGLYMFMLCYKNGALAREQVRDALNGNDSHTWNKFDEVASSSPPLNQRTSKDPMKIGLFFPRPETVPNVEAGTWRYLYTPDGEKLTKADGEEWPLPETDARAILESQFLSLRARSQKLVTAAPSPKDPSKQLPSQPRRIYLVGGGSANATIAQVLADVLGSSDGVYRLDIGGNACALGAAYKAVWGCERRDGESFETFIAARWDEDKFVRKIGDGYVEGVYERYGTALKGFEMMEKEVVRAAGHGKGKEP